MATRGSEGVFPFETRHVTLDNGFNAYLIHAGAPGEIAYVSNVRTGARDEVEEGRTGYAHFFEHMMFRGTEKYPNYDEVTSRIGASQERVHLQRHDRVLPGGGQRVPGADHGPGVGPFSEPELLRAGLPDRGRSDPRASTSRAP